MTECKHENLMRHEWFGQVWWQCEDGCEFIFRQNVPEGSWPADYMGRAFVEGAKWWEWHKEKATMWPSDRDIAEQEALRRYAFAEAPSDRGVDDGRRGKMFGTNILG